MARIIVAGADAAGVTCISAAIESLRHESICVADPLDVLHEVVVNDAALVFLDEYFPYFNALQITEMLREDPEVPEWLPIVIMACDEPNAKQMYEIGVTDYVLKEASTVTIQDMVVKYLRDDAGAPDATRNNPVAFLGP